MHLEQSPPEHDDRDFRRGYHHGYENALDDVLRILGEAFPPESGRFESIAKALAPVSRYVDRDVAPWRNSNDTCHLFVPPPVFRYQGDGDALE